jgi:predicted benzoate:H+ symporter BenE
MLDARSQDMDIANFLNFGFAALVGATSAVSVIIKKRAEARAKQAKGTIANEARAEHPENPLGPPLERLAEAKAALVHQESVALTNRWTSRLLTVGQYIIGGLLASSLVQQSLSRELVGAALSLRTCHSQKHKLLRSGLGTASALSCGTCCG